MNKKYQVFISSTYEDLKEERQKVIEALLGKTVFLLVWNISLLLTMTSLL